jgi:hypothetical protein
MGRSAIGIGLRIFAFVIIVSIIIAAIVVATRKKDATTTAAPATTRAGTTAATASSGGSAATTTTAAPAPTAPPGPPRTADWVAYSGVDAPGNDIGCKSDGSDVSVCKAACDADPECRAYVGVDPSRGEGWSRGGCCWKRAYGPTRGARAVTMWTDTPPTVTLKHGSGKCVHTANGTALKDYKLVTHDGCDGDNIKLVFNANGTISSATNRSICIHPQAAKSDNNTRLVWWDVCDNIDYIKWELQTNGALKHKKSGKCVHPAGGTANNNTELVIHDGCDHTFVQ